MIKRSRKAIDEKYNSGEGKRRQKGKRFIGSEDFDIKVKAISMI